MKLRICIYSILLIATFSLLHVYNNMSTNFQRQEIATRQQKKYWLYSMTTIELELTQKSKNINSWRYHFYKAMDYFTLALEMTKEDIDKLNQPSGWYNKQI